MMSTLFLFLACLFVSSSGNSGGGPPPQFGGAWQPPTTTSPPPPMVPSPQSTMGMLSSDVEVNNMEHITRYWGSTVRPDALVVHSGSSGAFLPGQQGLFPPQQTVSRPCYEPTFAEQQAMGLLKHYIMNSGTQSPWLRTVSDSEIVRFLRARKADVAATWVALWEHSIWRMNPLNGGADTISPMDQQNFEFSSLNQEMYWAGLAADGNPVLVFRSALHQSNVDVGFFTRFVVWQLEKGKRLYGVGLQRQLYIVMDRSPSKTAAPMLGPAAVTHTLPLLKTVFKIVQDNYPEVLCKAYVAPVNAITRMLFSAVSSMIDEKIRAKIHLLKADDTTWWHGMFHPTLIPRDLGGWSDGYRPTSSSSTGTGVGSGAGSPMTQNSSSPSLQSPPPPAASSYPHPSQPLQPPSQPMYSQEIPSTYQPQPPPPPPQQQQQQYQPPPQQQYQAPQQQQQQPQPQQQYYPQPSPPQQPPQEQEQDQQTTPPPPPSPPQQSYQPQGGFGSSSSSSSSSSSQF